jgi:hypothetical protein
MCFATIVTAQFPVISLGLILLPRAYIANGTEKFKFDTAYNSEVRSCKIAHGWFSLD